MTNSLKDILSGKANNNEPPEFDIIRRFVTQLCSVTPKLSLSSKNIIIAMPSSAAAGALRLSLHDLQQKCGSKYKLIIRISR